MNDLYAGKPLEEVKENAKIVCDSKKLANEIKKHKVNSHPFGYSLDALKWMKLETDKSDGFLIYKIKDPVLSGEGGKSYVFKSSKVVAGWIRMVVIS